MDKGVAQTPSLGGSGQMPAFGPCAEFPRLRTAVERLRVSEWPLLTKVATLDRTELNRDDGSRRPHRSPLEQKGEPAHKRPRARPRLPKPSTTRRSGFQGYQLTRALPSASSEHAPPPCSPSDYMLDP